MSADNHWNELGQARVAFQLPLADHADEEGREHLRIATEGGRKCAPVLDVRAHIVNDFAQERVAGLLPQRRLIGLS